MARYQSNPAHASKKTCRSRIGENGFPQAPLTPEQQEAANRTKTTVRDSVKRGSQETERAMGEH